jgi:hypothetical protein
VRRSVISTEQKKVCIRLDLEGEEAKGFRELLRRRHLTKNVELIRLLIGESEEKAGIILEKEEKGLG